MAFACPENPGLAPLLRPFPNKFESSGFRRHCSLAQSFRTARFVCVADILGFADRHTFLALRIWFCHAHCSSLPHIERRFSSLIQQCVRAFLFSQACFYRLQDLVWKRYRSSFPHIRRRFISFDLRLPIFIESRRSPGTFPVAAGSIREDLRNDTHHGDTLQFSHH